jgi:hypothetical protein
MAARNKPAGIRSLVYGVGKGKVGIEGLSVSLCGNPRLIMTLTDLINADLTCKTYKNGWVGAQSPKGVTNQGDPGSNLKILEKNE